jgi:hypothetical protein
MVIAPFRFKINTLFILQDILQNSKKIDKVFSCRWRICVPLTFLTKTAIIPSNRLRFQGGYLREVFEAIWFDFAFYPAG